MAEAPPTPSTGRVSYSRDSTTHAPSPPSTAPGSPPRSPTDSKTVSEPSRSPVSPPPVPPCSTIRVPTSISANSSGARSPRRCFHRHQHLRKRPQPRHRRRNRSRQGHQGPRPHRRIRRSHPSSRGHLAPRSLAKDPPHSGISPVDLPRDFHLPRERHFRHGMTQVRKVPTRSRT